MGDEHILNIDIENKEKLKPIAVQERDHSVILFDCDCHAFDTVVLQLQKAVGCSESQATQYAEVAQQFGSVSVFQGSAEMCNKVANILSAILLEVEVI